MSNRQHLNYQKIQTNDRWLVGILLRCLVNQRPGRYKNIFWNCRFLVRKIDPCMERMPRCIVHMQHQYAFLCFLWWQHSPAPPPAACMGLWSSASSSALGVYAALVLRLLVSSCCSRPATSAVLIGVQRHHGAFGFHLPNDVEHRLPCIFAIPVLSFVKCLNLSPIQDIGLFSCYWVLWVLYISWIKALYQVCGL